MNPLMLTPTSGFIPIMPVLADGVPSRSERENVGLALRKARKAAGIETAKAAELGGISVAQLGNIERGNHPLTSMSAGNLSRLPAAFGLSWPEFVELIAPVYGPYIAFLDTHESSLNKAAPPNRPDEMTDSVVKLPFTMKNVYDLAQASRPLTEMEPDPEVSPIPVPNEILRPGTEIFRVRGDSMQIGQSGILEGDFIFVDTRLLTPVPEGVFVISIPGSGVTVKRVRKLGPTFWLFSDNPDQEAHPPFAAEDARIVGRVHMSLRIPDVKL